MSVRKYKSSGKYQRIGDEEMEMTKVRPVTDAGRIVGLDILRTLSMCMVLVLHILGQGGILNAASTASTTWYAAWAMESFCFCAVDCYGLLTGYLGGPKRHPRTSLLLLWLEVVFYSLLVLGVFLLCSPWLADTNKLFYALFPVTRNYYWYFTSYFGLALLMPLLNAGLVSLDSRRATRGVIALFILFSFLPTFFGEDTYKLQSGYSVIWLVVLYLLGSMLRKSEFFQKIGVLPLILFFLFFSLLTFYGSLHHLKIFPKKEIILLKYCSPTVTGAAVCLLLLFRKWKGGRTRQLGKVIAWLSQASFAVYILHTSPMIWAYWFPGDTLASWGSMSPKLLCPLVLICAVAVYLCCCIPELLRWLLFKAMRLRQRLGSLENRLFSQHRDPGT